MGAGKEIVDDCQCKAILFVWWAILFLCPDLHCA